MSGAPQFYISLHEKILFECVGCTHVTPKKFGGNIGMPICTRYSHPKYQFLFGCCKDFYPISHILDLRELISQIENILMKIRIVEIVEAENGKRQRRPLETM